MSRKTFAEGCRLLLTALLLLGLTLPAHAGQRYYRYVNADGLEETSSSIPNELVKNGYDILDANMRLIERVPRGLNAEEIEEKMRREAELEQCLASQKRVRALYESEEDIAHAEQQALDSIATRIANAEANLVQVRKQHLDLQNNAARLDRAGKPISEELFSNISNAKSLIANLEAEIAKRNEEKEETRRQHAEDLVTFQRGECLIASTTPTDVRG